MGTNKKRHIVKHGWVALTPVGKIHHFRTEWCVYFQRTKPRVTSKEMGDLDVVRSTITYTLPKPSKKKTK